jgi:hypothetical protein
MQSTLELDNHERVTFIGGKTMRKFAKKTLVIMLSSLLAISLTAGLSAAVEKLVVQDGSANNVFTVDDAGAVNAVEIAIGTTLPPTSQITVVDETNSPSRGIGAYQATSSAHAGVIDFRKMRGAYTPTPTAANATLEGDYVGAFHAWGVDAAGTWRRGATINYYIDGPPTDGGVPIALFFSTGTNDDGNPNWKRPRMTIGSNGKVLINDLIGTGNAYVCVDATGTIFRSLTACR